MRGTGEPFILAVCGWKGSGKTTLIERLAGELSARGFRVLTAKRAGERLRVEEGHCDSARMFAAGADVYAFDDSQSFLHLHGSESLSALVGAIGERYDVVLVEGHKGADLPKLWLLSREDSAPPAGVKDVRLCLPPGPGRVGDALRLVEAELGRRNPR